MENEIRVLIIEDEVLIAETIRLMLEDFGYSIAGMCYTYEMALAAIASLDYDLILTDINLGDGNDNRSGFSLITEMSAANRCPFVFLTAFDDKDTIRRATALHPSAYLTKPINAANLYASLQLAVEDFRNDHSSVQNKHFSPPDFLYLKVGKRMIKFFWTDVYCMEAGKNYVLLKTPTYPYGIAIRSSLLHIMQEMVPIAQKERFVKISRSMIIDKTIVRSFSETHVETTYGVFKCNTEFREIIRK